LPQVLSQVRQTSRQSRVTGQLRIKVQGGPEMSTTNAEWHTGTTVLFVAIPIWTSIQWAHPVPSRVASAQTYYRKFYPHTLTSPDYLENHKTCS